MRYNVYSIRDMITGVYGKPLFFILPPKEYANGDEEAMRWFGDACVRLPPETFKKASDFRLVRIGQFDDAEGVLVSLRSPEFVCEGSERGRDAVGFGAEFIRDVENDDVGVPDGNKFYDKKEFV